MTEVGNITECNKELLDDVNPGGLSEPTTYCFTLTCLAYLYFQQVQHNISAKEELLKSPNQRDLFVKSMLAVAGEELPNTILCDKKHDVQNVLFKKVFNCFSKNFLKRLNAPKETPEPASKSRKLRKLQSASTSC